MRSQLLAKITQYSQIFVTLFFSWWWKGKKNKNENNLIACKCGPNVTKYMKLNLKSTVVLCSINKTNEIYWVNFWRLLGAYVYLYEKSSIAMNCSNWTVQHTMTKKNFHLCHYTWKKIFLKCLKKFLFFFLSLFPSLFALLAFPQFIWRSMIYIVMMLFWKNIRKWKREEIMLKKII